MPTVKTLMAHTAEVNYKPARTTVPFPFYKKKKTFEKRWKKSTVETATILHVNIPVHGRDIGFWLVIPMGTVIDAISGCYIWNHSIC